MTWHRAPAADALVKTFEPAVDPTTVLYPAPAATYNVPALIVAWVELVEPAGVAFGIDRVTLPVLGAVGLEQPDGLDDLLAAAAEAIRADRQLGGAVQACFVRQWRNQRALKVGGADFLVMDLLLEIHM